MSAVDDVGSLRTGLWAAGFRPVPVFNPDAKVTSPGKQPLGDKWQLHARMDPPFCANSPAVPHALNTGVLADGLRPLDFDIDDPDKAAKCRALATRMLGPAPTRIRQKSPRALLVYRAAEGCPGKRTLTGSTHTKEHGCKIEVLGKGQQFVGFGRHASGADLKWYPAAPGDIPFDALTPLTEAQITAFLEACAPIIDAPPPPKANGHDPEQEHTSAEPQADSLRIAAALAAIPNAGPADWETWNRIGMALWAATGGSETGRDAFEDWSALNAAYDAGATHERWENYAKSPPNKIGAGTIFRLAAEHGWVDPRQAPQPPLPESESDYGTGAEPPPEEPPPPLPKEPPPPDPATLGYWEDDFSDADTIADPPRNWVVRDHLLRGTVTCLFGATGEARTNQLAFWYT